MEQPVQNAEGFKEQIKENVEVIKEASALLPDTVPEQNKELWNSVPEQVDAAITLIEEGDKDELYKLACIADATTKYANQITFWLYRHDLLTDDLTAAFRKLSTPEETTETLSLLEDKFKEEEAELLKSRDELIARQDAYEIIQAVLGGYSVKDALKRQEENRKKMMGAMGAK